MGSRTIKRHDTHVMAWARFLDEGGTPLNLTGCTVVYTLRDQETGALRITRAAASIRNQTTNPGEVLYQFTAAQTATVLYGPEEWEVTYTDATKESFPVGETVIVTIEADVDNT